MDQSKYMKKIYGVKCPDCGHIHLSDTNEWQIIKCEKCGTFFQAVPK